jgi:hypothetical protein
LTETVMITVVGAVLGDGNITGGVGVGYRITGGVLF